MLINNFLNSLSEKLQFNFYLIYYNNLFVIKEHKTKL